MNIDLVKKLEEKGFEIKEIIPLEGFPDNGKRIIFQTPEEITSSSDLGKFLVKLYNENGLKASFSSELSSYDGIFNARATKGFYSIIYVLINGKSYIEEIDYLNPTK